MKILLTWYATGEEVARVRKALPAGTEVVAPAERSYLSRYEIEHEDVAGLCAEAEAIMGWVVPPETWEAAPRLGALAWLHAGCDELDFEMLRRRDIQVANIRGGNAIAVAEQGMALMLALAKRVVERHRWVLEARWQPTWHPDFTGVLLEGRTLAVIGLGQIGSAVAKRAKSFDMRVIGLRRRPELGAAGADEVHGPQALHEVLGRADVVMLATPLTAATHRFIDEAALAAMKPGALLVNIARGMLVRERALHEALTEGRLAGYAADVWWSYENALPPSYHFPIVSRTGLHRLPNVIASGDQAANVEGVKDRLIDMGAQSLAAFARGEPMPRAIDLVLGY